MSTRVIPAIRPALLVLCWGCIIGPADAQKPSAPARGADLGPAPAVSRKRPQTAAETKSIETLTANALKSVAVITHYGRDGKEDGVGAGFVVGEGLIATSLHVIGEARPITVRLADGERHEVLAVQAWDRKFDLAVLKVEAKTLPILPLGDSDTLKQGAGVLALGNPLGLEHSVVQGVLSARRDVEGNSMLQIAIPIEPGNSGGPLLDLQGRVQGILTLKSALTANLGFAMPVNLLKTLLDHPNPVPMTRWLTIGALNAREWTPVFGAVWSQKAGRIHVEGAGKGFGGRSLCLSQKVLPDRPYEISVQVRLDDEAGAAGLVFSADGGDQHYGFYPSAGQLRLTRFEGPSVYSWTILKQVPSEHYRRGDWNHLRVRLEKDRIRCYVNDALVIESTDDVLPQGRVGLAKFRETRAEFRDFQLGTNMASPILARKTEVPEPLRTRLREASDTTDPSLLKELENHGVAGREALNARAAELEGEARRLRLAAGVLHRQAVQRELTETLAGPEEQIDLLRAALLVARLDNPDLNVETYRQQVAEMAAEIQERLPAQAAEAARLQALRDYLFAENGFHGSRSDYYNQANSYLNEVLEDREGLPITLAVLFLDLAERLHIHGMSGLPLPGHFMVRHIPKEGEGAEEIIDVFGGGTVLSRSQAQDRVTDATGEGFRDADYRRATKREIIVRMLRNLQGLAERNETTADLLRYLDVIVALVPDSVSDRWRRAELRLQAGDTAGAKIDLKWLLDEQPPGVNLERIAELFRSL